MINLFCPHCNMDFVSEITLKEHISECSQRQERAEQLEHDIKGLMLIIQDGEVSSEYLLEKLQRILDGTMIFHPTIEHALEVKKE